MVKHSYRNNQSKKNNSRRSRGGDMASVGQFMGITEKIDIDRATRGDHRLEGKKPHHGALQSCKGEDVCQMKKAFYYYYDGDEQWKDHLSKISNEEHRKMVENYIEQNKQTKLRLNQELAKETSNNKIYNDQLEKLLKTNPNHPNKSKLQANVKSTAAKAQDLKNKLDFKTANAQFKDYIMEKLKNDQSGEIQGGKKSRRNRKIHRNKRKTSRK